MRLGCPLETRDSLLLAPDPAAVPLGPLRARSCTVALHEELIGQLRAFPVEKAASEEMAFLMSKNQQATPRPPARGKPRYDQEMKMGIKYKTRKKEKKRNTELNVKRSKVYERKEDNLHVSASTVGQPVQDKNRLCDVLKSLGGRSGRCTRRRSLSRKPRDNVNDMMRRLSSEQP